MFAGIVANDNAELVPFPQPVAGDRGFNGVSEKLAPRISRSIARLIARSFVCSLARSRKKKSKNSLRRHDRFGPKIVKIGAILAIFWPFKDFYTQLSWSSGVRCRAGVPKTPKNQIFDFFLFRCSVFRCSEDP